MSESNPKGQRRHRLGDRPREKPGEGSTAQADARGFFLLSLRRVAPEALKDLAAEPYELASTAFTERGDVAETNIRQALPPLLDGSDPETLERLYTPQAVRAASRICAWGNRWNTGVVWILDQAAQTLAIWCQTVGLRERLEWGAIYTGLMVYEPPEMSVRGWNPYEETENEASARMMKEFKRSLTQHLNTTRKELDVQTFEKAPQKASFDHFDWLVRYQVLGESYNTIAIDLERDIAGVYQAIGKTAKLVGLPLRASPPGRPKAATTT